MGAWPLWLALLVLAGAALLTIVGGARLSALGDVLADRLGVGEALFGAVCFGAVISLSGIVMTATAAAHGLPKMAFSNAVGGVAAQTAVIAVADLAYRRANLEHAAASLPNMLFTTVVLALLSVVLLIRQSPDYAIFGVHPGSIVLVLVYLGGLALVRQSRELPQWQPRSTSETVVDEPDEADEEDGSTASLAVQFVAYGAAVAAGGWAVAQATASLVTQQGLEESFAGAAVMGVTNALPEAVTSIAAVRRGAVTLALGGVLGGNAFDVLNVAVGDVAFRGGSIYHVAGNDEVLMTLAAILLTTVILAGMLRRQRRGPGGVGFEGVAMLGIYVATLLLIGLS